MRAIFLLVVIGALAAVAYYYFGDQMPKFGSLTAQTDSAKDSSTETSRPLNAGSKPTTKPLATPAPAVMSPAKPRSVKDQYDYLVVKGQVFEKVTVTEVYPDSIAITHREGAARINAEDLKPSLQEKYGFTSAPAKEPGILATGQP